jgi:hypothetical protein
MITNELQLRRVRRTATVSRVSPDLVPHRVIASNLGVSVRLIRLWIDSGAWPLPRAVGATNLYFNGIEVDCWTRTGTWPDGVRFGTIRRRLRPPGSRR